MKIKSLINQEVHVILRSEHTTDYYAQLKAGEVLEGKRDVNSANGVTILVREKGFVTFMYELPNLLDDFEIIEL